MIRRQAIVDLLVNTRLAACLCILYFQTGLQCKPYIRTGTQRNPSIEPHWTALKKHLKPSASLSWPTSLFIHPKVNWETWRQTAIGICGGLCAESWEVQSSLSRCLRKHTRFLFRRADGNANNRERKILEKVFESVSVQFSHIKAY